MKITILTFVLLSFTTPLFSQNPGKINGIKELADSIEIIMKQEHITGLMLGITTKDSVLFCGGFGYADVSSKRRVDKGTLFRMGSITKMFVSLAIMKLVEEKKLNLNDEVKTIAPEVPIQNKWEITDPIRVVNLLEHTSGFDDMKLNRLYSADTVEKRGIDMMLVQKNSMVCRWKPGERFAYSNPNYSVLGYLIEKITGKPYDQYLMENILTPLGMRNSNFNARSKLPQKDVKEYTVKGGQTTAVKSVTLLSGPQGALWSSAEDMLLFLQLFLRDGSPLFQERIINEIETTHSSLAARRGQKNGYSLGNENTFFTHAKYAFRGHGGLAGTCFSSCLYNRELGFGFVIASNSNNNNARVQELVVSYLQQDLQGRELVTQPIDEKVIETFLGRYQFQSPRNEIATFSDKLQNAPKIYTQNGKLYIKPLIGEASELVQTAPMIFAWRGHNMPTVCFTKNDNGKNVMLIGGIYYEQTSNFWAMLKRAIISIALVLVFSTVLMGIVSLLRAISSKNNRRNLLPRILPMIGVGLLVWATLNLLQVQQYTYLLSELGTINFRTTIIFFGTSAFGIISIICLFYSLKTFPKQGSRWFAFYLLLTSISLCLVTAILWQHGWIGLRT